MKRMVLGLSLTLALAGIIIGQRKADTSGSVAASQDMSSNLGIASGTQVSGQLQNTLDVQKARVGDQVLLKTTKAVKENGQTVIGKGSMLVGHVTEVSKKAKGDAASRIGVLFDRLQQGGSQMPINAFITSITQANVAASVFNDDMQTSTSGSSTTRSSAGSSGNGALLGGVGNTVGGVTNTVGSTAGSIVNSTTRTVGTVTNTAGETLGSTAGVVRGPSISQSTSASAQGGSTLSMTGGNLRLDKGTTFNLAVSGSASARDQ